VLEIFPQLKTKRRRYAETLSGGERKMTAIARVLMLAPKVLVLDEPTASLTPEMSRVVLEEQVRPLSALGKSVLLVEQSVNVALSVADRVYVMDSGAVRFSGTADEVRARPELLQSIYLAHAAAGLPHDRDRRVTGPDVRPLALDVRGVSVTFGGIAALDDVVVFHAGTTRDAEGRFFTSGGRVVAVTGLGANVTAARQRAYEGASLVTFEGCVRRSDVAWMRREGDS